MKKAMNLGFWEKLKKPIMCLAPMAEVTDAAFRQMFVKYGKPDVFWTEFISADGLCSAGQKNLLIDLLYSKAEHPIVAQIFGAKPENFYKAARLLAQLGFDGIDINMGCPDRKVEKQGAGAALMKNYKLAQEIILATKEGAAGLPVSVKTRIGYSKNEIETWIPALLEAKPAVIIIHGRTRKEMSRVPAHWEDISRAGEIVRASNLGTLIIGNGDVTDLADAYQKAKRYKLDGIMVGRSVFGNPWWFTPTLMHECGGRTLKLEDKLKAMVKHVKLFEKLFASQPASVSQSRGTPARRGKNFNIMKKHFKAYVAGFEGAKELRVKLMGAKTAGEAEAIVRSYIKEKCL